MKWPTAFCAATAKLAASENILGDFDSPAASRQCAVLIQAWLPM